VKQAAVRTANMTNPLYAKRGRPSIPPERLLRALLLQASGNLDSTISQTPTSAIRARREAASWAAAEISIQQLQRKLDLSRRPGRVADEAKTGAKHDVRGQSEVDQIENVEKFRAELQLQRFPH